MAIIQIAPPGSEPVTLADLKAHLNQTLDVDDDLITAKGKSARQYVERQLGRALISTEYELVLDAFPAGTITIPGGNLLSVDSIKYLAASDGTETTLDPGEYIVDTASVPGRIAPVTCWPPTASRLNAVRVRFHAGYGDDAEDVPEDLLEAILQLAAHWYENREAAVVGVPVALLPLSVAAVLREHRVYDFSGA